MTTSLDAALHERIAALQQRAQDELAGKIITVMSGKGGVGKTLLSMELSYLLNGVLVDFDWDDGNATRALGHLHERYQRIPLLDAFAAGRAPAVRRMKKRPDLVPGHPDFETNQQSPAVIRDSLTAWSTAWNRLAVVDCHPGGGDSVYGAVAASDAVLSPVELATRELDALEGQLKEFDGYPMMLVPNEVPSVPPQSELNRLSMLAQRHDVQVASPLYEQTWYRRRKLRTVLTASSTFSKKVAPFVEQLVTVGEETLSYAA